MYTHIYSVFLVQSYQSDNQIFSYCMCVRVCVFVCVFSQMDAFHCVDIVLVDQMFDLPSK